jgi:hypothetical protein
MEILNGNILGGIDYRVHINGVIPPALKDITAGAWKWISDGYAGGNALDPTTGLWTVLTYNINTQQVKELSPVCRGGANDFYAGGGMWALRRDEFINGKNQSVVYSSWGTHVGAGLYGISPEGDMLLKPDYAAAKGLRVYFGNGGTSDLPDAATTSEVVMNNGRVVYVRDGKVYARGRVNWGLEFEVPASLGQFPGKLAYVGSTFYRCHEWGEGLVVMPFGSAYGWLLDSPNGKDYHPSIEGQTNGTLTVVSSSGAGERVNETNIYQLDPVDSTLFDPATSTWKPYPATIFSAQLPVPQFPPTQKPMWVIPFDQPGGLYLTDINGEVKPNCKGIWVGLEGAGGNPDAVVEFLRQYPIAAEMAKDNNLPLYIYFDSDTVPGWFMDYYHAAVEGGCFPVLVFSGYPKRTDDGVMETLDARVRKIELTMRNLSGNGVRFAVAMAYYTQQGNWPLKDVLLLQEPVYKLAVGYGAYALLPFDWTRVGGITSYGELMDSVRRLIAAVPNHPEWPLSNFEPAYHVPVVTVNKWFPKLTEGAVAEVVDTANPDLGYKFRVIIRGGGVWFEIENKQGVGKTGAFRPVIL